MAEYANSTPVRAPHFNSPSATAPLPRRTKRQTVQHRRQMLEMALDRLLGAVDGLLADLDAIDGDPDFEPSNGSLAFSQASVSQVRWAGGGALDLEDDCEDEGAQCEDEGHDSDREPDEFHQVPDYADGGMNQTRIISAYGPGVAVSPLGAR